MRPPASSYSRQTWWAPKRPVPGSRLHRHRRFARRLHAPSVSLGDQIRIISDGSRLSLFQRFRIDHVDRLALGVREQPVDRAAVDAFVLLLLAVAEVRRADHVLQL